MGVFDAELTIPEFAEICADGAGHMLQGICAAEAVAYSKVGRKLRAEQHEELYLEIARCIRNHTDDIQNFDLNTEHVKQFQLMIGQIIDYIDILKEEENGKSNSK